MFGKFASWVNAWRRKKRFWRHYRALSGDDFAKGCAAFLLTEVEDETVAMVVRHQPPEQRETFLMIYECFLIWLIKVNVERNRSGEFVQELVLSLRDNICTCGHYQERVFEQIWEAVQDVMPGSLKGGARTGVSLPWVQVVEECRLRGFNVQHDLDPSLGMGFSAHVIIMFGKVRAVVEAMSESGK